MRPNSEAELKLANPEEAGLESKTPQQHEGPAWGRSGVGICLSGGGLRAASFSLGALQALETRLHLLRGEQSARWLSAVSGGSYTAGTLTLINAGAKARYCDGHPVGAVDLEAGETPLEQGSPEVRHMLRHCRYMVEDGGIRTVAKIGLLLIASFVTLAAIIIYIGTIVIGGLGALGLVYQAAIPLPDLSARSEWVLGLAGLSWMVFFLYLGARYRDRHCRPHFTARDRLKDWHFTVGTLIQVPFMAGLWAFSFLGQRLESTHVLSPSWFAANAELLGWVGIGLVGLTLIANRLGDVQSLGALRLLARSVIQVVAWVLPPLVGIILVAWAGGYSFHVFRSKLEGMLDPSSDSTFSDDFWIFLLIALGAYIFYVLANPLPGLVSPHRPYRSLVSRCFAVYRVSDADIKRIDRADEIAISSLAPPKGKDGTKYPELIVSAAANFSDPGDTPAGSNVLPLTISAEGLRIPTESSVGIPVANLEAMKSPIFTRFFAPIASRFVAPKPMMSLAAAIGVTGAALSPAMGRMSKPRLRPILAAFNIRLGVWLPNPLSEDARSAAAEGNSAAFFVGIEQLIFEMLGRHSAKRHLMYASDGGHYENLGILELLRKRCTTIWAVDASGDPPGRASALTQAILLAEAELGCRIDIDVDAFAIPRGGSECGSTHAKGDIRFSDGVEGTLHVVKLGITSAHSSLLHEYQRQDVGFPYHSTSRQVYKAERFEAYRRLGFESTILMLDELALG